MNLIGSWSLILKEICEGESTAIRERKSVLAAAAVETLSLAAPEMVGRESGGQGGPARSTHLDRLCVCGRRRSFATVHLSWREHAAAGGC